MSKPVRTYLLFTFGFTWLVIISAWFFYKTGYISLRELNLVYNLGAPGPFLGALMGAYLHYGKPGVKKLFSTFHFNRLGLRSLSIALSPLVFLGIAFLVYPLLAGHEYSFADTKAQAGLYTGADYMAWLLPFFTYAIFEEFGWRGFMLPHLQQKNTAFRSGIYLAVFWALWHLPFFLWRFQFSGPMAVGFFFSLIIGSIILTAAFNSGKGSIVPTILFHLCNNLAAALDKTYMAAIVSSCFILLAYYLVRYSGTLNLSRTKRIKNIYLEKKIA